jgi:UbiD family decarboxylase
MDDKMRQDGSERPWFGKYNGPHRDLREFIERAEREGEILRAPGADWDLEMGALAEIVNHARAEPPAILFEDIKDYPAGYRAVSGLSNSSKRLALALGFAEPKSAIDVVLAYRDRMKHHQPIPPVTVRTGPVLENVMRGDEVDLWKFPVPRLHEKDGGRYIGTDDLIIMRDPEGGWVNAATYRVQVHDARTVGIWISPGKQGRQIRDKYFKAGQPCPVLICCGQDPLLFLAANHEVRYGVSEIAYAGGHRGEPFEVIASEVHGLPMPAHAEIVLEGTMYPGDVKLEGPFGEFTGYYASGSSEQPVVHIERIYHRNDPIMGIACPMRPPTDVSFGKCIVKAGMIWDELERAGISGIKGVWCHEAGVARLFNVISLKQAYAGHAKQALLVAAGCQSGAYVGRFTIVVDEDVDPTDMFDVIWAMSTRCDPIEDIDFIRRMWTGPLDPMASASNMSSRALIDACRPFERLKEFPEVASAPRELIDRVAAKFADVVKKL